MSVMTRETMYINIYNRPYVCVDECEEKRSERKEEEEDEEENDTKKL